MKAPWWIVPALILSTTGLAAQPAHASPILPDPNIGVIGDDVDPPSIFDSTFFMLTPCDSTAHPFLADFFCAAYRTDLSEGFQEVTSLDLIFLDIFNRPFTAADLHRDPNSAFGDPVGVEEEAPFRVQISSETPLMCTVFEETVPCHQLEVYSDTPGSVSIRAVDGTDNPNLAQIPPEIPEPGTLLLLGSGVIACGRTLLRRGRRRD